MDLGMDLGMDSRPRADIIPPWRCQAPRRVGYIDLRRTPVSFFIINLLTYYTHDIALTYILSEMASLWGSHVTHAR